MKCLSDMTLEQLWQLFPVTLEEHNPLWKTQAEEEIAFLADLLSKRNPVIHHIGSTAIPGIKAKPIVDILVELPDLNDRLNIKTDMEAAGFICMSESESRMSFNKGYTPVGYAERVYHVHFHLKGDNEEVLFRDYLIGHPESASEYERLKLGLLPAFRHNRDAYTAAKTEFVEKILTMAHHSQSAS